MWWGRRTEVGVGDAADEKAIRKIPKSFLVELSPWLDRDEEDLPSPTFAFRTEKKLRLR